MATKTILDPKDFYMAYTLVYASATANEIPADVMAKYNEYLEYCREQGSEATNEALVQSCQTAYYMLKRIVEGDDWAARLH